ncbi:MAG: YfhO family protein, partial [Anaerolineae bacterium]|nr:YfhO family protein [Anaerolineae bacterium]
QFSPRLNPILFTAIAAALICFDLFSVNWQTNLFPQPPEWHTQEPPAVQAIKNDATQFMGDPYRVYNEFRLYDNYGVPFELEDMWGASPLRPERYDRFLAPPMPIERTWELLNVRYVITWREELFVPSLVIYQEPAGDDTTYVHRLESVGPRAWLTFQAEIADEIRQLERIAEPDFDRWQTVLLEPDAAPAIKQLDPPLAAPVSADIPELSRCAPTGSHLSFDISSPTSAFLVLSEPFYPGWRAVIDGQPAPLLRANYVLRAIPIPAGDHRVEVIFRPLSFTVGAVISAAAAVIIVVVLVLGRLKRNT